MTGPGPAPSSRQLPDALAQLAAPPIFVVGAHRSGTTWVFDMLAAHPEVAGVFESGLFAGDLGIASLFHPGHWYDPETQASDQDFFGRAFRLPQLVSREQLAADVRDLTASWLATSLEPQTRFLVEKTPQHAEVIPVLGEVFPGATVVNVIRDGRDVIVSGLEAQRGWQGGGRVRKVSVPVMARRWAHLIRAARHGASISEVKYTEVRFENLHANPGSIADTFEVCGIPATPELIASIVTSNDFKAQGSTGSDAFRRSGRVGDWKGYLGPRARLQIERAAGETLRELGYEAGPGWWLKPRARGAGE